MSINENVMMYGVHYRGLKHILMLLSFHHYYMVNWLLYSKLTYLWSTFCRSLWDFWHSSLFRLSNSWVLNFWVLSMWLLEFTQNSFLFSSWNPLDIMWTPFGCIIDLLHGLLNLNDTPVGPHVMESLAHLIIHSILWRDSLLWIKLKEKGHLSFSL